MRVIAEIPHDLFRISIFSWNSRFIVKIELDQFEQLFKIPENDISGLEQVKSLIDEEFLDAVFQNFLNMRNAFGKSYAKLQDNF
jgi:hypothetical protein